MGSRVSVSQLHLERPQQITSSPLLLLQDGPLEPGNRALPLTLVQVRPSSATPVTGPHLFIYARTSLSASWRTQPARPPWRRWSQVRLSPREGYHCSPCLGGRGTGRGGLRFLLLGLGEWMPACMRYSTSGILHQTLGMASAAALPQAGRVGFEGCNHSWEQGATISGPTLPLFQEALVLLLITISQSGDTGMDRNWDGKCRWY